MNERQQSHIDYYLQRLAYWQARKPAHSTARLLAARDADEAHPLRTEEEAAEVIEYLRRLEREQAEPRFTFSMDSETTPPCRCEPDVMCENCWPRG